MLIPLTGVLMIIQAVPFFTYRYLQVHTTVEAALRISKILRIILVFISLIAISSASLALIFLGLANGTSAAVIVVAVILRTIWCALLISTCYLIYKTTISCHEKILAFHDFLISYRQTPRSKILRRHLPSMDAVVEEQS